MKELEYLKKYVKNEDLPLAIKKLEAGMPVQYIIGNVDFYGNYIKVTKDTLIPRFETELLVDKTINYIKKYFHKKVDILDIGTGSGCIAITLNKKILSNIDAVDISEEALNVAKENNEINKTNVNFIKSDIFPNVDKKYDIIISNPPYIAYDEEVMDLVKNNEPHLALYAKNDGLYFYEEILKNIKNYLQEKYLIAFEIGYLQGDKVAQLAHKYLDNIKVSIEKDYTDKTRFVFITNIEE